MIGNSLRRVLLSSIPGAAPIAVRIEGVPHEFSVIEGVVEDVVQIILNLKKLVVAMDGDEIRTLTLDVSGERVVTAADIIPDAGLTIINPELHIAELSSSKSTLRMDILVSKGRGYVPTEKNKRPDYPIGTIWMDAMFTPVKNVKFAVEQTLIEQYLDFEKLTLDILCNGAVPPKEALDNALQILSEYYMAIGNPELLRKKETSLEETLEEKLALLIENVLPGLSPKVQHLLVYADIKTMRDLLMKTKTELVQHHNITHKAITELAKALEESQEYATFSQFNFPFLKEEGKAEIEDEPKEVPVTKAGKVEKEPEIMEPEEAIEEEIVEEKVETPVVEEPKPAKPSKVKAEKEQPKPEPVQIPKEEPKQDITKGFSIQDISLSKSTMTFLQQNKITDLASLLSMSKSQIEGMKGFKPKMIQEIEKNLDKVGLVLAQDQMFGNLSPQEREKAVWSMSIEDLVKEVPSITKAEMKSMNGAGIAAAGKLLELGKKGMKGSLKFSTKTIEDIEKRLTKWGLTLKE